MAGKFALLPYPYKTHIGIKISIGTFGVRAYEYIIMYLPNLEYLLRIRCSYYVGRKKLLGTRTNFLTKVSWLW